MYMYNFADMYQYTGYQHILQLFEIVIMQPSFAIV